MICTSNGNNFLLNFHNFVPLGDLYELFIFLSWSLSIIHMVTYLKKTKTKTKTI